VHYRPFYYPLDAVHRWNRLYGKRGLLQWQCVVPTDSDAIRRILEDISRSGEGSFLAVLKTFGDVRSPGLLSFPRPGVTLALDFPNRGERTFALLDRLDAIVREHAGALYPAKDARMSPETFRAGFPQWERLAALADPRFSSSFWRRVTGESR
jgi:FAD/FMN-containing dehydrogenase